MQLELIRVCTICNANPAGKKCTKQKTLIDCRNAKISLYAAKDSTSLNIQQ
jgi:hypothetical protein